VGAGGAAAGHYVNASCKRRGATKACAPVPLPFPRHSVPCQHDKLLIPRLLYTCACSCLYQRNAGRDDGVAWHDSAMRHCWHFCLHGISRCGPDPGIYDHPDLWVNIAAQRWGIWDPDGKCSRVPARNYTHSGRHGVELCQHQPHSWVCHWGFSKQYCHCGCALRRAYNSDGRPPGVDQVIPSGVWTRPACL
jgi:hypothetical protein